MTGTRISEWAKAVASVAFAAIGILPAIPANATAVTPSTASATVRTAPAQAAGARHSAETASYYASESGGSDFDEPVSSSSYAGGSGSSGSSESGTSTSFTIGSQSFSLNANGVATAYVNPVNGVLPTYVKFSDGTIADIPWITATSDFTEPDQSVALEPKAVEGVLKDGQSYYIRLVADVTAPNYPTTATAVVAGQTVQIPDPVNAQGNQVSVKYDGQIIWEVNYNFQFSGPYAKSQLPTEITLGSGEQLPVSWKALTSIGDWENATNNVLFGYNYKQLQCGAIANYYTLAGMTQASLAAARAEQASDTSSSAPAATTPDMSAGTKKAPVAKLSLIIGIVAAAVGILASFRKKGSRRKH